jgi:hypothetical protein
LGYPEGTPQYDAAFTNYCQAVQEHLRDRGWLDEGFVYWFDEPQPRDYDFVRTGFERLEAAAPDIRGMLTEQPEPGLYGAPDIWCPISYAWDDKRAQERMAAGDAFWWYVCTGPKAPYATLFIDHPGTEMRVWLWQTWKRGIDGVLAWQTNYWTSPYAYPDGLQNPYEDPMSWVSGYGIERGQRLPWGNGDGRFLYPPLAAADGPGETPVLEPPVPSIRLAMLRDGIEDYEYLKMLSALLKEKGKVMGEAERKRLESLLDLTEITQSLTEFAIDPAPLVRRRHAIAQAIESLSAK